jgi:hypothetical protein
VAYPSLGEPTARAARALARTTSRRSTAPRSVTASPREWRDQRHRGLRARQAVRAAALGPARLRPEAPSRTGDRADRAQRRGQDHAAASGRRRLPSWPRSPPTRSCTSSASGSCSARRSSSACSGGRRWSRANSRREPSGWPGPVVHALEDVQLILGVPDPEIVIVQPETVPGHQVEDEHPARGQRAPYAAEAT